MKMIQNFNMLEKINSPKQPNTRQSVTNWLYKLEAGLDIATDTVTLAT